MSKGEEHKKHKGGHSHEPQSIENLLLNLQKSDLKLTKARRVILQVLVDHHGPFTAKEIHKLINKKICDQATVYRNLLHLEEAQILRRVEFGDGNARFELCEADGAHHHHLICTKCKRIEIIDEEEIEEIDRFPRKRGFTNIRHTLEFFGTCPQCK